MLPCLRFAELFTNSNFASGTASKIDPANWGLGLPRPEAPSKRRTCPERSEAVALSLLKGVSGVPPVISYDGVSLFTYPHASDLPKLISRAVTLERTILSKASYRRVPDSS
jgi:hypothetical protein